MSLYAIRTRDGLASYRGRVMVHDNRAELEFLFPCNTIVDCTGISTPTMHVGRHPQCQSVEFPLDRNRFETGPRHLSLGKE